LVLGYEFYIGLLRKLTPLRTNQPSNSMD